MDQINLKKIIHIIFRNPIEGFELFLIYEKYKLVYLFPVIYGIFSGISKSITKVRTQNIGYFVKHSLISAGSIIVFAILYCFVYAKIVLFISHLLKGLSNFKMTFSLVLYSLFPTIIGAALILIFKLILYINDIQLQSLGLISVIIYSLYLVSILWSLYILVKGNALINEFSTLKSFLSSVGIAVVMIAVVIIVKLKH